MSSSFPLVFLRLDQERDNRSYFPKSPFVVNINIRGSAVCQSASAARFIHDPQNMIYKKSVSIYRRHLSSLCLIWIWLLFVYEKQPYLLVTSLQHNSTFGPSFSIWPPDGDTTGEIRWWKKMKKVQRGQWHNEEEKVKKGGSDGQKKWPNIAAEEQCWDTTCRAEVCGPMWGWLWVSHANLLGQTNHQAVCASAQVVNYPWCAWKKSIRMWTRACLNELFAWKCHCWWKAC